MHSSELSLLAFTLLGQFALGLAVFLIHISSVQKRQLKKIIQPDHIRKLWILAFVAMVLALIISFLHLSAPLASVFALSNLQHSWLSREIFTASLFTLFLLITIVISYRHNSTGRLIDTFAYISTLAGVLFVFSMAKLYMLPTVPAWNTPETILAFFTSGFVLAGAFAPGFILNKSEEITDKEKTQILYAGGVLIGLALVMKIVGFMTAGLNINDNIAFGEISYSRLFPNILWFGGVLLFTALLILQQRKTLQVNNKLIYFLPFILFLFAEIFLRMIFYASYYRVGI